MFECNIMKGTLPISWHCRDRMVELGDRTLVMGILNVTPDSFSDGGRFADTQAALEHARQMIRDGADLIDVGGESTRPKAETVPLEEELKRVVPVIEVLCRETDRLISIDTRKARVAEKALQLGAHIINDVSALTADPAMPAMARDYRAGVILMHMRGDPGTMQNDPQYVDVVKDVADYLGGRMQVLQRAGLSRESMAIDPGIGFGKTVEHNISILAGLDRLKLLGRPIVIGVSRKSFIGKTLGREMPERLAGSLASAAYAIVKGAHIIRVHDVKESCDVAHLMAIFRKEESSHGVF